MSRASRRGAQRWSSRWVQRLRRRAAGGAVAALAGSGCGSGVEPTTVDPTTGPTVTVGASTTGPVGALPPDRVVWQVDTGGGLVPFAVAANDVPEVTIYGDGRVFLADPDSAGGAPAGRFPPPMGLVVGRVAGGDLAGFLTDVESSGVVDDQLTEPQQQARRTLERLVERSERLAGETRPGCPIGWRRSTRSYPPDLRRPSRPRGRGDREGAPARCGSLRAIVSVA